jgi:hypothetical protein
MEALAGISSILQLVDFTAKLLKTTSSLCRSLQDAPKELEDLKDHLNRIRMLLVHISLIETNSYSQFPLNGLPSTQALLSSIESTVLPLQQRFLKYEGKGSICRRLKLAVLELSAIKKYAKKIQNLETELTLQLVYS